MIFFIFLLFNFILEDNNELSNTENSDHQDTENDITKVK